MTGPPAAVRQLVLISGPIASGKTTLATTAVEVARGYDIRAAAIDMDEVVAMVAGPDWSKVSREHRDTACGMAAAMTDRIFDTGAEIVLIAGSTTSAWEWGQLRSALTKRTRTLRVWLHVSLAESIRRAQSDPDRVATKVAAFVESNYNRIDWQNLNTDLEIDTEQTDTEAAARTILEQCGAISS